MPRCNRVETVSGSRTAVKILSACAGDHLKRFSVARADSAPLLSDELQPKTGAGITDEYGVFIRMFAGDTVIKVQDNRNDSGFCAERRKKMQKGKRIRPAGNGKTKPSDSVKKAMTGNEPENLLFQSRGT